MMTKINYQPWLQAVLMIAKHYRIEPSEERVRLQLDWNQNQNLDEILLLMCRQVGLHLRKVKFSDDVVNPWRLPVIVELNDGQVGVIDKADTEGNVSVQLSGDHGLSQKFAVGALKHIVKNVYVLRPEKSVPDARVDESGAVGAGRSQRKAGQGERYAQRRGAYHQARAEPAHRHEDDGRVEHRGRNRVFRHGVNHKNNPHRQRQNQGDQGALHLRRGTESGSHCGRRGRWQRTGIGIY